MESRLFWYRPNIMSSILGARLTICQTLKLKDAVGRRCGAKFQKCTRDAYPSLAGRPEGAYVRDELQSRDNMTVVVCYSLQCKALFDSSNL
jgi:hypothetical protein